MHSYSDLRAILNTKTETRHASIDKGAIRRADLEAEPSRRLQEDL